MYVAELEFSVIANTDFNRAEMAIRNYIEALIFNGQVLGREFPTAWLEQSFNCRIVVPDTEALQPKHHSIKATAALNQLAAAGLAYPKLKILGMDLMSQHTDPCSAPASYVVYSRFSDTCSAVRCAEHLAPVPLYQLTPPRIEPTADFEDLIRWQLQYQALDEIQMQQQRVLHKSAERSLQQLNSQLNRQGRQLAKQLEHTNKVPVYYALYSGTSVNCSQEADKRCPSCQGEWRLTAPIAQLFDFQCQRCRLVSNIAWDCQSPS